MRAWEARNRVGRGGGGEGRGGGGSGAVGAGSSAGGPGDPDRFALRTHDAPVSHGRERWAVRPLLRLIPRGDYRWRYSASTHSWSPQTSQRRSVMKCGTWITFPLASSK